MNPQGSARKLLVALAALLVATGLSACRPDDGYNDWDTAPVVVVDRDGHTTTTTMRTHATRTVTKTTRPKAKRTKVNTRKTGSRR